MQAVAISDTGIWSFGMATRSEMHSLGYSSHFGPIHLVIYVTTWPDRKPAEAFHGVRGCCRSLFTDDTRWEHIQSALVLRSEVLECASAGGCPGR